jgi:hypothetical protein
MPVRPEAVLTDRALCLPTFSHSLNVNKTSLWLSLPQASPEKCSLERFALTGDQFTSEECVGWEDAGAHT